jgi:predicted ribosomally synthesized peptide with SipW-like signal peptide
MRKSTKGALAAGTAAVLLTGGAGSLAYWTATDTTKGAVIGAGQLGLTQLTPWLGRLVAGLVILAAVAALVVTVLVPRLTGATPYTIRTGSMTPALPPGTLVSLAGRHAACRSWRANRLPSAS